MTLLIALLLSIETTLLTDYISEVNGETQEQTIHSGQNNNNSISNALLGWDVDII